MNLWGSITPRRRFEATLVEVDECVNFAANTVEPNYWLPE